MPSHTPGLNTSYKNEQTSEKTQQKAGHARLDDVLAAKIAKAYFGLGSLTKPSLETPAFCA